MPQFLPTSYLRFAVSPTQGGRPNLYQPRDAIFSVGNFLKEHGWLLDNGDSHLKALFEYNRSKGYVDTIMKIAEELATPGGHVASTRTSNL